MQHTFLVPIGLPILTSAPPPPSRVGEAYYDTVRLELMVWSGSQWIPVVQPTHVIAGAGLTGTTAEGGVVTIEVGSGPGIAVETDKLVARITPNGGLMFDPGSSMIVDTLWLDERIRAVALTPDTTLFVRRTGDTMSGNLSLPAGIAADHAVNKSQLDGTGLRTVNAGDGLHGGGSIQNNPTISVGAGDGITLGADTVGVNWGRLNQVYAQAAHGHTPNQAGIAIGRTAVGSIPGGDTKTITINHGLGKTPTIAIGTAHRDTGVQSGVVSSDTMSSSSVVWKIRNNNNSEAETLELCWLVA